MGRSTLDAIKGLFQARPWRREAAMSLGTIVLITLIIALFAVLPTWPHSADWGYAPTALVGMLLLMAAFFLELVGI
jgi:drug/metabolite transporter superfamily protein YnfA